MIRRVLFAALTLVVVFLPQAARAWWNDDWSFRKKITIDATPKGAALAEDPGRIPVLVRLHDGNFRFADAADDGRDLRFIAGDDKTPLKFHIESYDGVLGIGLVWVDVPAVRGGAATDIWLYSGNPKAPAGADAPGTYDGDTTLVYHFAERNAPPRDSSARNNHAQTAAAPDSNSLIGSGAKFDGSNAVIVPASPTLATAAGGGFTWSAWIRRDPASENAVLFARRDGAKGLIVELQGGAPRVSVEDQGSSQASAAGQAIPPGSWHHVAVTASDQFRVFVDGQVVSTLAVPLPTLAGPASIGAEATAAGVAPGSGYIGEMDEVQVARVARGAGPIAAAVANQGPDGKLLVFGVDEQASSGGFIGVILKSVTFDGWVVIGLLGVMAVISWVVMVNKAMYLTGATRANARFLAAFRRAGGDIDTLETAIGPAKRAMGGSPIYRIYRAGVDELAARFAANPARRTLSDEAVASIRAGLDGVTIREGQRLNSLIVLLTIAISGGPFLGLLGTVVGVMITFAAIAAAGDVNINAIAPGMAAALAATVAGLGVAIPALFGYNYLTSRIKDVTADMQVFVEEFATRLAETYRPQPDSHPMAAE
jgi:biopolymer transport protein ExbB